MAIEYRVSGDGLRVDAHPNGVLDLRVTNDYFDRLEKDDRVAQGAVEVVHFEGVTDFRLSYLDNLSITKSYQAAKSARMIRATVFVCVTELAYGIGRMLQALHDLTNPEHEVAIVRSETELGEYLTTM